ncbi:nucleolar protein 6-like [Plakobranchus ocellatus]|uniref:Nucleolar protein 6 n=1 Tax=Plakobranchus ocellatus TaxID=259542 RepID=A0AAV4D1E6_9GAST|nr:nucleolar protein 6-like [Plakobranchus ocellatus]
MKRRLNDEDSVKEKETAGDLPTKSRKKSTFTDREFNMEEISKLKETEALYHSSLFRLQVSELLREISVKQKMKQRLEEASRFLSDTLKNLPSGKEHKITDRKWLKSKHIKNPILEKPFQVKGTFLFSPPLDVFISGSFVTDTMIEPDIQADLVMIMPKTFFQPKDYLNQRYSRKRALYLCAVASHLENLERVQHLQFSYFMGNPYKPMLVVKLNGHDLKQVSLSLHAVPESGAFKESRFHVSKNNVRPGWFFEKSDPTKDDVDAESLPGTPYYNSSILHDLCWAKNGKFVEKFLGGSEGVRDGIKLLKVWLNQRELLKGFGAFSGFLISCYVAHLIMVKKINKLMNFYQVFRTTLLYLSKSDWVLDPPSFYEDEPQRTQPTTDEFRDSGSCVFIDRSGFYNLAFSLPVHTFSRVKHEAKLSVDTLEQQQQNTFDALFMTSVSFPRKFDHIFHVEVNASTLNGPLEKIGGIQNQVMDVGGHSTISIIYHVVKVLSDALGKRAVLVQPRITSGKQWAKGDDPFEFDSEPCFTIGISIDNMNAFNILDKGPAAEAIESRDFRAFWGEKSEMRRFKDGTIHEAVLWTESSCQSDRRLVCKRIVHYVLERHCGILSKNIQYMEGKLDPLLHLNLLPKDTDVVYGTGEEQSLAVHHAFDHVTRAVRALTSLPLSINSVQGIHPVFRHACVFPPLPVKQATSDAEVVSGCALPSERKPLPPYVPALKVICMLEGSGKWPEETEAIKGLKTLLHIKMGTELKDKLSLCVSIDKDHVDVVKDGFVFRLIISNTRELAVLRTVKTESGMVKFKDTEKSFALEKEIIELPRLTHLLHSIQQENPVFSATVRLCKRWLAAQMVWGLIAEEALDLMVAFLFTSPHPYSVPGSPIAGLLRFLHLLSTFNWKADPLMVNLNKDFKDEDFTTIPKEFQKNRATLPCMCICTPPDKQGTKWTKPQPTEPFLKRLIVLARESLAALESQIMNSSNVTDFKMIFRPPLSHFDLVIHLLKKANILHYQGVDEKSDVHVGDSKTGSNKSPDIFPVVEFCVATKFLDDLKMTFGDFAWFFYDPFGGSVIGIVWKVQAFERKEFKVSNFRYRKPVIDGDERPNLDILKESILDDIRVIGGGLVESIVSPKASH